MASKASNKEQTVYQLKVTIRGSKPPIWRRIEVTSDTTLTKLHQILQIAFGWTNSHLHQFVVNNKHYAPSGFGLDHTVNEQRVKLEGLGLQPKIHFGYDYDFGDNWEHDILVEKILPVEAGGRYPRVIAGKLSGPPEDCGGIWGYYDLLETIKDPKNPDYEDMREWLGGDFDPEAFDLDSLNAELKSVK
jgi:hypothetical protein